MAEPPVPKSWFWRDLGLGAALVLPTGFLELGLEEALKGVLAPGVAFRLVDAFLITALVEEVARLGAVRFVGRRMTSAGERAAAGARVGLGLALFEGFFYLESPAAALLRVGLSTPSHVLDGWIMGAGWDRPWLMLAACVGLHGLWDFGAFMVEDGVPWWGLAIPVALWLQVMLAREMGIRAGASFPALAEASLARRLVRGTGFFFLAVAGVAALGVAGDGAKDPLPGAPAAQAALPHLVVGAGLFAGIGMVLLALSRPAARAP